MADHNADYMYDNGGVWDRIFFKTTAGQVDKDNIPISKLVFHTFFGVKLSSDIIANTQNYSIVWNLAYPYTQQNLDFAQLSGGKIKILKSGYYFINFDLEISDMTGSTDMWGVIKKTTGNSVEYPAGAQSTKLYNETQINICRFMYLGTGDILEGLANRNAASSFRIDSGRTSFMVVPMYIK